ncbi:MAG: sodium:solute symporter family protein [Candidatus Amoebophilus sp.]
MNYFNVDYLIVYGFLAITVIIGIWSGRGIKDIREYAIANKSFGTAALVLTLLATNIAGASVINGTARVFSAGIIMTMALLGVAISFIITALLIAPKVARFNNCLTMGDLMKGFYGPYSGIIAGSLGLLNALLLVGMELHVLGIICEGLLGIPAKWGIIVGGLVLAAYSAHGGIKSVTTTDILQFIMLAVFIPLIAYKAVGKIGGIREVIQQTPAAKLEIFTHKNFSFYLTLFLMWIIPAGMIDPAIIQRLLMAKTGEQLRNQYLVVAAFDPVFRIAIMLIGLAAFILYPTIKAEQVIPHVIHNLLPVGVQGLAIAGVLAVAMSTIDSYLHAAGLTLTHDIIQPIYEKKNKLINEVKCARYATILIGVGAIYIGLKANDILGLAFDALEFTSPLLMFPLLSGIMGLKTDKQDFYVALIVTLIAFALSKLLLPASNSHFTILISMAANGISFFGTHFIRNKGFAVINRGEKITWKPRRKSFLSILNSILPTPKRIVAYSQNKVARYGAPYLLFGIFCIINYTVPYFIWMKPAAAYENLMINLRLIGGVLCVLLIVQEKWPKFLLRYMPTFWHVTVLYCLPFTNTVMFLLTAGSEEWLMSIIAVIILLIVLLDWASAIMIGILGVVLGLIFYQFFIGPLAIPLSFNTKYSMIYQGIFGILIGLIFARRKERRFDRLATDNQTLTLVDQENKEALLDIFKEKIRLLKTLKRAGVQNLTKAVGLVKDLRMQEQQGFKEATEVHNALDQLQNTLTPMAVALERIESRATDYMRLNIKPIAVNSLLAAVQTKFSNIKLLIKNSSVCQELICDPERIQKILVNSIEVLKVSKEEEETVYMKLEDTYLIYPLPTVKKDKSYVKKVPGIAFSLSRSVDIPSAKPSYEAQMQREALSIPTNPTSLLLVTNERIVKAHYGYTNIDISKPKDYTMHRYVLPVRVSDVRPRDMDDPYMELGADLIRADDTYPGALEQEKTFLRIVGQKTNANLAAIETAIEMIKWYHGPVKRKSGEPFYLHPIAVAQIVLDYNTDEATILGALLHDIVEDTSMLLENIELMFGQEVASIVDGVTHFESRKDSFYRIQLSSQENILMLLETEEKRALYVKIADRMHNMRTIKGHSSYTKRRQIAEETLQFFVPLARELGLETAATELKERSMAVISDDK